jgi:hypothetical protein
MIAGSYYKLTSIIGYRNSTHNQAHVMME